MKSHKAVPFLVAVYILMMFTAPAFAAVIYVDADATSGVNNGESWANAYIDLQDGLATVTSGDEIWVAKGTYKPTTKADRTISFAMKDGVAIYGGFTGTETARNQRDWTTNVTILSGNIGNSNDARDNSYHVLTSSGATITSTSVLDGFTITGSNADGNFSNSSGGGMYNDGSSPTVTNCTFSGNTARNGSGMYNTSSSPVVTNCTFSGNSTTGGGGGGMYNESSNPMITNCTLLKNIGGIGGGIYNKNSSPTLVNSTFSENTALGTAGGIYNKDSNPTIINCTFSENSAGGNGGGMYNADSNPTITNCTISTSEAIFGGAMYNKNSNPIVNRCSFPGNSAISGGSGGGIYNKDSSPIVTHCIFSDSEADFGGGIYNDGGSPTVSNCIFSDNSVVMGDGGGMYNEASNSTVVNCIFFANSVVMGGGGGMCNESSSPTVSNCIFFANSVTISGGGIYNINSNITVINCILWDNSPDEIYDDISTSIVNYSIVKGGYTGIGNLDTNPLFVDPSSGNFRLQESSPAIDAGNDVAVAGVITDLEGNPRIAGAAVDMGAYESLISSPPPVVLPPVIPGLPLPIVITAEVSDITATGAVSGGNVVYPEGCTALLVGRGVAWDTVSPPTYPEDAATFDGWESGEYTSILTNLVPQTKYYIRAYVQYKLHNVLYTRYSEYIYNFTTPAIPGDVNGDKVLDLKDAILALKIVAGAAGNVAINLPADVNEDGKIGIEEAVYVLQHLGSAE